MAQRVEPHSSPAGNSEKTWTAINEASGATPAIERPLTVTRLPATIPATWVPCVHPLMLVAHGSPLPTATDDGARDGHNDRLP
jgi:hypothetical protein